METLHASRFTWTKNNGRISGCAEASGLGFPPGVWPSAFIVVGKRESHIFTMNTLPHPAAIAEANERGHTYTDINGVMIEVLND